MQRILFLVISTLYKNIMFPNTCKKEHNTKGPFGLVWDYFYQGEIREVK